MLPGISALHQRDLHPEGTDQRDHSQRKRKKCAQIRAVQRLEMGCGDEALQSHGSEIPPAFRKIPASVS